MKRREFIAASGALMAGSLLQTSTARAEDWPTHELTMILAFAAGSGADTIARMMAKLVSQELKVNVNVKNVLGGSGLTGFAEMVNSKPDGYTFGIVNVGALTVLPHVMQVPFKLEDVGFLSGFSLNSYGIGTAVNSDFKTVDDIVRIGKTRVVTYSTATILNGFVLLQLGNLTGAKFRFVSANTNQEAVAQAAGGHVDLTVQGPADMVPLIDGGNLRLIASATETRWPNYPDIKTVKESGYNAATVIPLGYACPAKVPKEIQARLEAALSRAAVDKEVVDAMLKFGMVPGVTSGAEFGKIIRTLAPGIEAAMVEAGMKKM